MAMLEMFRCDPIRVRSDDDIDRCEEVEVSEKSTFGLSIVD